MNRNKLEKIGLIQLLIGLSKSDNRFDEIEKSFISKIAEMIGISRDQLREIENFETTFAPPKSEFARILQFQQLILLMNIDGEISENEKHYIRDVGIRMGLNAQAIEEVLVAVKQYPNGSIPPKVLIDIFTKFHN
ncbi:MAG: TerB family tellurite resistance protein [Bacteroidetes bacterium]|nr:MAG: TerB family tellurite resistance protein [Bacteroidota bacterium]